MKPRITIGLPFYNAAPTLKAAIQSVFAQSERDWELLLIDDGSTDGSVEVARSVSDPRVVLLSDGRNQGLGHRLNEIADRARGQYLFRMDADDLMHPHRVEQQLNFLSTHGDVDLVDTAMFSMNTGHSVTGIRGLQPLDRHPSSVLNGGGLLHPTVAGHTRWFRRNPYDNSYLRAEDHELWCRTCRHSRFDRLREPLYFYREDLVSIDSYVMSCRTDRRIFRTYGPELAGYATMLRLIAGSHIKSLAYRLFGLFQLQSHLVRRRNWQLSEPDQARANRIVRNILSTTVPGMTAS